MKYESDENHDPIDIWWDLENHLIPADLEVEEVFEKIIAGLRRRKYMGPVKIRAIYARYSMHITKELERKLKSLNIDCQHLGYDDAKVPGAPVTIADKKDNAKLPNKAPKDIADKEIIKAINEFISDPANAHPHIIMIFITGDHGFQDMLTELNRKSYKTLAAFRPDASAEDILNDGVFDSWF